jgi:formate dehydrogenase maturation protein FdhE
MNQRIPVKNEKIERDINTNALIFTDQNETDRYERRRMEILKEKQEIQDIKNDVKEIKELLQKILKKESN